MMKMIGASETLLIKLLARREQRREVLPAVPQEVLNTLENGHTSPNKSGANAYISATQKHSSGYGTPDLFTEKQTRVEKTKAHK